MRRQQHKQLPSEKKRINTKADYLRELDRIYKELGIEKAMEYMLSDANPDKVE